MHPPSAGVTLRLTAPSIVGFALITCLICFLCCSTEAAVPVEIVTENGKEKETDQENEKEKETETEIQTETEQEIETEMVTETESAIAVKVHVKV